MLRRSVLPLAATVLAVGLTAAGLTAAAGCGGRAGTDPNLVDVVAAFYPVQFLAERIGGDRVVVTNPVAPGAEPHDIELTPSLVAAVADADLVLYLRGFQPAVDEAVEQHAAGRSLDLATIEPLRPAPTGDHEDHGPDPHIWLDPVRFSTVAEQVAGRLSVVDPQHSQEYAARAADLRAELAALDRAYATGLATCARRDIVTSHAAFGYLTARYRLDQIPVTGLSPEEEATPREMARAVEAARDEGATTVFFEPLANPGLARALAGEIGARAALLDPVEGIRPGAPDDYLSVMRRNLATLRTALACS